MYLSPTSDIRVETEGSDVRYEFPVRPLGKLRWFGLVLVAFSVLFVWMPARSLFEFLEGIAAGKGDGGHWVFVAFLIPFVLVGLFPMLLGLLAIGGRCRVEWRGQRLWATDYVGPIRWRRRMPRAGLRKFTVKVGGAKVNEKPVTGGPLADLGALMLEFERGKPRLLVLGYPREWLQTLAEDLSARVGATAATAGATVVEVVDAGAQEPQFMDVTEQPADSRVRVESRGNDLRLVIPPAGLRRGGKGLLGFGIVWCLFMCVFTGFLVFGLGKGSAQTPWPVWIFIAVFWAIGLGMLAVAINMGRRQATLQVEAGRLSAEQRGLFGAKRREWHRGEIAAIRADASGMEVNHAPLIELQIHPVSGKKVGFFAGRDEQELRWIATQLRRALSVPARDDRKQL